MCQVWSAVKRLDLTPFSGYNFAVKPATNHPSSSCRMHTWENVAEKYSKWYENFCASLGFEPDTRHLRKCTKITSVIII